ncbi:MAG: hypothetical protein DSZ23_04890 [Thermodesulfatator sp.]|nr:MAG: hypothetical protein DSZ23_04890 [Thermodesulfatator sp.]
MTKVQYLFSTPDGNIPAPETILTKHIKQGKTLASDLTLKTYFDVLKQVILENWTKISLQSSDFTGDIKKLFIICEKCGLFYHVARARIITQDSEEVSLAVITAFDESSRNTLKRDHEILGHLWKARKLKMVPRPFFITDALPVTGRQDLAVTVSIMEWLNDYHEWHFTRTAGQVPSFYIVTWQPGRGIVRLPEGFSEQLFELISRILAYYFDPVHLFQICLWSNPAGDFVVSWNNTGGLSARLTTIRRYAKITGQTDNFDSNENLLTALLYLFLDTVLNIRLDRLDGTGRYFLAGHEFLLPTISGFFQGLSALFIETAIPREVMGQYVSLLKALSYQDLRILYRPLMDFYRNEKRQETGFLENSLPLHCSQLASVLADMNFHDGTVPQVYLAA